MADDMKKNMVPVTFETFLMPARGPKNEPAPYDFDYNPELCRNMVQKIEQNVAQFGTVEAFVEKFQNELTVLKQSAEQAVRVYEARRRQMEFIRKYMDLNTTKKNLNLDA